MKIFKNYSVVNYFVILGLALTLLFLSACGKKENADEIKLPLETKQIAKKVVKKSTSEKSEKSRKSKSSLNLRKPAGVLITAELISENKITPQNLFAEIITIKNNKSIALSIASSTNYNDGQITFPEIKKGLTNLQIVVKADNIAETSSELFDTLDGINKTIQVDLLEVVEFYGRAVRTDGTPITNVYFQATPRGLYEESQIGHVDTDIEMDFDGNFIVDGLLPEHYKISVIADGLSSITTNVVLYSDEENRYVFIFPAKKYLTINGMVLYGKTDGPAEGIEVNCDCQSNDKKMITKTDIDGKFKFCVLCAEGQFAVSKLREKGKYATAKLTINEPEYAKINKTIFRYDGKIIKLYLRECGIITGTITDNKGNPIQGIKTAFKSKFYNKYRKDKESYCARNQYSSNEEGVYVISNVAAPDVYYLFQANGNGYSFLQMDSSQDSIKVNPNQTTVFNFKISAPPKVKVKFIDENGNAILKYKMDFWLKSSGLQGRGTKDVNLDDASEWYNLPLWNGMGKMKLSIIAQTDDEKNGTTNNIQIASDEEYKIILKVNSDKKANVSGFVYDCEMKPIVDQRVSAGTKLENRNSKTDYLGFFEIFGMNCKTEEVISLNLHRNNVRYTTNVFAGSEDIEWILPKPKYITGRVFIENLDTPATYFDISISSQYNKKSFHTDDGSFSLPIKIKHPDKKRNIKVSVFVDGYAPESRGVNISDINTLNLGDIIFKNKTAGITGKVVDEEYNPLESRVSLMNINNKEYILSATTDKIGGSFEFTDIPPGKYQITAYTRFNQVKSEVFELSSEEEYTLPDLVVVETNLVKVLFKFVLTDGTPAAYVQINYLRAITDRDGILETKLKPRNYQSWKVEVSKNLYYTKDITINKNTKELTIKLIPMSNISGTVTLNGKSLNNVNLSFKARDNHYNAKVHDGKFELKAKPGKYAVACSKKKVVTEVELKESDNNIIEFKSGTSTFEFEFPYKSRWSISLNKTVGKTKTLIADFCQKNIDKGRITELPEGYYTFLISGSDEYSGTNFVVNATIKSGETKKIKF